MLKTVSCRMPHGYATATTTALLEPVFRNPRAIRPPLETLSESDFGAQLPLGQARRKRRGVFAQIVHALRTLRSASAPIENALRKLRSGYPRLGRVLKLTKKRAW